MTKTRLSTRLRSATLASLLALGALGGFAACSDDDSDNDTTEIQDDGGTGDTGTGGDTGDTSGTGTDGGTDDTDGDTGGGAPDVETDVDTDG